MSQPHQKALDHHTAQPATPTRRQANTAIHVARVFPVSNTGRLTCKPKPPVNRAGAPVLATGLWAHPYTRWSTCNRYTLTVGSHWQCSYRHLEKMGRGLVSGSWPSSAAGPPQGAGRLVRREGWCHSLPDHCTTGPFPTTWLPVPVRVGAHELGLC